MSQALVEIESPQLIIGGVAVLPIREAARKYDIPESTLRGWIREGVLRTERHSRGQTSWVLVCEEQVAEASKHYIRGRGGRGRVAQLKNALDR